MKKYKYYWLLAVLGLSGCGLLMALFSWSESIIHTRNNFIRRYVPDSYKAFEADLQYNSFYYAGLNRDKLILGNSTAPLLITEFDTLLEKKKQYTLSIDETPDFKSPSLLVDNDYFALADGVASLIYTGKLSSHTCSKSWSGDVKFSQPQLVSTNTLAFRTIDPGTNESELAVLSIEAGMRSRIQPGLLEKQIDGIFDVDGRLHFDTDTKKLVYVYHYRNEYIVADSDLKIQWRGNTIDTTSQAKIEVATIESRNEKKFSAPPLMVNKTSGVYGNLLFINSQLIGKYEDIEIWDQASIIDVYDYSNKEYISSFYIYHDKGKKLRNFFVYGNYFYAFIGNKLIAYKLSKSIQERI